VFDLSEMSEEEVKDLFARPPAQLCVSYLSDRQAVIQLKRKPPSGVGLAVGLALTADAATVTIFRELGPPSSHASADGLVAGSRELGGGVQ
jgi:hypothetical protein